jgi:hypothetical protein
MIPNPPLGRERVEGVMHGFKAARIVRGTAGLRFAGAAVGTTYGPADEAVCVNARDHVPPHPGCACGFYSWKDRDPAALMLNELAVSLLEVELWGAFHEYELGYVAAVQVVRRVTLMPYCHRCLFSREVRLRPAVAMSELPGLPGSELVPVCDDHAGAEDAVVTLAQLAEAFEVEVAWADDDDEIVEVAKLMLTNLTPRQPLNLRRLDELLPGELAHVFQNAVAQDADGHLYIDVLARLVQPLPGTDVPICLNDEGEHQVLLTEVTDFTGWRPRNDARRFTLPLRTVGQPQPRTHDKGLHLQSFVEVEVDRIDTADDAEGDN